MKCIKIIVFSVLCVVLGGCSVFGPVSEPEIIEHAITAVPHTAPTPTESALTLLVQSPSINPLYRSTGMVYSTIRNQPKAYTLNEWAQPPAIMFQPLIVQTLQKTGLFKAVLFPPYVGRADVILSTHIIALHMDYTQPRKVLRLSAHFQITDVKSSKAIRERTFKIVTPIGKPSPRSGVIAANKATRHLLQQLARFAIATLND